MCGLEWKKVHQDFCLLEENTWKIFLMFVIILTGGSLNEIAIYDLHLIQGI